MPVIAIIGAQWGDEGKGKVVDLVAEKADIVVRFSGGDNAGHTVIILEYVDGLPVSDILEFIGYGEYSHVDAEEALSERVEKIMSRDIITVTENQDLGYLAGLVESTGLGGFPVVDKNKLLGIVTISDMIKAVYH